MRFFVMTLSATVLLYGTAVAQSDWDANADGMIDREEFRAGVGENAFGAWDTDQDGMLSRDEYEAGVEMQDDAGSFGGWDDQYKEWDADQDETLSADEYNEGLWSTFDMDEDEVWDEEEAAAWEEDDLWHDSIRSGREVYTIGPVQEVCNRYPEKCQGTKE